MKVNCYYCNKRIEKKIAFAEELQSGRHHYYCTEAEFFKKKLEDKEKAEEKAKEQKLKRAEAKENRVKSAKERANRIDPVYEAAVDILGYRTENSIFFREMKLWRGLCDDEIILAYLSERKDELTKIMSRQFDSEYVQIRYFSAILKNSLVDYKNNYTPKKEPVKIEANYEMYEPVVRERSKKKRRGLDDLEGEV